MKNIVATVFLHPVSLHPVCVLVSRDISLGHHTCEIVHGEVWSFAVRLSDCTMESCPNSSLMCFARLGWLTYVSIASVTSLMFALRYDGARR